MGPAPSPVLATSVRAPEAAGRGGAGTGDGAGRQPSVCPPDPLCAPVLPLPAPSRCGPLPLTRGAPLYTPAILPPQVPTRSVPPSTAATRSVSRVPPWSRPSLSVPPCPGADPFPVPREPQRVPRALPGDGALCGACSGRGAAGWERRRRPGESP